MSGTRTNASFRDPDGFLFERDGVLFRQIQSSYAEHWKKLQESGLLRALHDQGLLVSHHEEPLRAAWDATAHAVIRPEPIPFISYPYEWSPSQLRDAGLLTLRVQRLALSHGMTLKDASAYNIQFIGHRAVFIDTLSFAEYRSGDPWVPYRQFCQHFLAPLAVMRFVDPRLRELLRSYLDGIPLDLASRLLPWWTRLLPSFLIHIHLHAAGIRRHADTTLPDAGAAQRRVSPRGIEGILGHLESAVASSVKTPKASQWQEYEREHNYSAEGQAVKERAIEAWAVASRPAFAIDLGANAGHYSQRLANTSAYTVAIDGDLGAVERLVARVGQQKEARILPLWIDLANPSPSQGWAHRERSSLAGRGPAELVLALALVHHVAISNNVPLPRFVAMIAELGTEAIIEWVPKDDPQVQRLLISREDIFSDYTREAFEEALGERFRILDRVDIPDCGRTLYRVGRT